MHRFNEGVTDIKAESIQMIDDPKEVFTDYKLSHIPTMYVCINVHIIWMNVFA